MARILIREGGAERTVDLLDPVTTFGRAPENKVVLQDKELSRRHFQIEKTDQGYKLVDLESRNGTRVNDRIVNQSLLNSGDLVQVGKTVIQFVAEGAPPPPPAAKEPAPPPPPLPEQPLREVEQRRRGSATTSVDKIRGVQRARAAAESRKEQQTLRIVGGIAGGFLGVIVLLVLVSMFTRTGEPPKTPPPQTKNSPEGPRKETPVTDDGKEEAALFGEIVDLQRTIDVSHLRLVEKCDEYLKKFPDSKNAPEVRKIRTQAEARKEASGKTDLARIQRQVDEHFRAGRYIDALRLVNKTLEDRQMLRFKLELEALRDKVLAEADLYYKNEIKKGLDLRDANQRDEARAHFERLKRELAGVTEFDDKVKTIDEALATLK